ncbi:hypothetical protein BDW59DRAFT_91548 [Aspergillus cavernicola]|uniref:Uncharacterized protein n=1 Tax=Aspergillus cavernicola TaxID=176166 RepID=A0ABR4I7Y3_9EURO
MGKKRKRPVKDDRTGEESGQHQPSKCSSRPPRADGSLAPNVAGSSHPVISLYYRQVVTLRQYILQRIPRSSKARRRKIAAVRSDDAEIPSTDHGKCLADLLDTTLVGIWEEISPTRSQERRRDFIAYTQTQRVTQMNTDIGPQCLQSEVI